jgi:ubiquinone biosynthesis protein COQ4
MVAALGETTAGPVLPRLLDHMLESEEGRRILKERPRINTSTIDMAVLARLPENSFGHAYVTWLERCGVTPDTREPVRFHPSIIVQRRTTALLDHADHAL